MNAIELLKADHKKVKNLFERGDDLEGGKLKVIFDQIKRELETHTYIEETIFYPAVEKIPELKDMVRESIKEHNRVKTLLKELESLTPDDEAFEIKFEDLMECVEHHAEEEEEGKMFPRLQKLMSAAELEQLGRALEAAKLKAPTRKAG
ncbi:MAG TPA: hemerythrin domain-containing protein [Candidatus Binatia bacterium]|nr:hemerythrin domain-containing protein [Candidatus Binatia bacterium]